MIYLVFYDITSDKIRNKVAKRLVAEGYERIQLSVFAGLADPKQSTQLWTDLTNWLSAEQTAKFYVVRVSKTSMENMTMIGEPEWGLDYLLGMRNSLFF